MDIDFKFNKKYIPLLEDQKRYLLLQGGRGSGKSYFTVQKLIFRCLSENVNHRLLVIRKVKRDNPDSTIYLFKLILDEMGIKYKENKQDLYIRFLNNTILFRGLDEPQRLKSMAGVTGIWIEESTEITENDFLQLDAILRGEINTYKQIILSFNPTSKNHWLYKKFVKVTRDDTTRLITTYKDNPYTGSDYYNSFLSQLEQNEELSKSLINGEFYDRGNLVYTNYEIIEFNPELLNGSIIAGMDFGWNDPNVFLLISIIDNDVYIIDEIYQSKLKNRDFINKVRTMIKEYDLDEGYIDVYCDHREDIISEFEEHTFLNMYKAEKNIVSGISEVKNHKIYICSQCINTLNEIDSFTYKKDREGGYLEKPNDGNDHSMDSLRYGVYNYFQGKVYSTPQIYYV